MAEKKVCVVTGGASGIGKGVAMSMGKKGYRICLIDLKEEALSAAASEMEQVGITAMYQKIDVTKEEDWAAAVNSIVSTYSRLDVLVQAAGVVGKTNIKTEAVDPDNFDFVMAVNVKGIFLGCRAVLPRMVEQKFGRIINIASISGKDGNAGMLAYSTSKAAVIGLTKVVGKEYAEHEGSITVNCIAPAVVRTPMVAAMPDAQVKYMTDKIPMKRTGEIAELAHLVEFIASEENSFTTGFCYDATGGRAVY